MLTVLARALREIVHLNDPLQPASGIELILLSGKSRTGHLAVRAGLGVSACNGFAPAATPLLVTAT